MTTAADTATSERRDRLAREYLGKLLESHRLGASENDIRSAFHDFLLRTGIAADESEIVTETRPAADSRRKVDLYLRNGEILRQHTGLKDITESDLFTWPLETGEHSYLGIVAWQATVEQARSTLRNGWQPTSPTAQAIEAAVEKLLTEN